MPTSNNNPNPSGLSTTRPAELPKTPASSKPTPSPPIDPSKLNHQPAPLPTTSDNPSTNANTTTQPTSPPLRSASDPNSNTLNESAYLDTGLPVEPASHPTIAETGLLATSPSTGPGPLSGQLERKVGGEKKEGEIISLGSFGGEGLKLKPPTSPPMSPPSGSGHGV